MNIRKGKVASVAALLNELRHVLENGGVSRYPQISTESLGRQDRTAAISVPELGVVGMSLGTFKSAARHIDGGFAAFDSTRKEAMACIANRDARQSSSESRSKLGLVNRLELSQRELGQLREDLMHFAAALKYSLSLLRSYAERSNNPVLLSTLSGDVRSVELRLSRVSKIVPFPRSSE